MERFIARVISVVFHPLLMPTYFSIILLNLPSYISFLIPIKTRFIIEGLIFAISFVLPILVIVLLKNMAIANIKSWTMDEPEERNVPYIISAFALYITHKIFSSMQLPVIQLMSSFLLGSAILVILTFLINFKWKISAHMIGIGGLIASLLLISLYIYPLFELVVATIFISGILGFARLKTESHNPLQVYVGYLLGVVVMAIVMFMML